MTVYKDGPTSSDDKSWQRHVWIFFGSEILCFWSGFQSVDLIGDSNLEKYWSKYARRDNWKSEENQIIFQTCPTGQLEIRRISKHFPNMPDGPIGNQKKINSFGHPRKRPSLQKFPSTSLQRAEIRMRPRGGWQDCSSASWPYRRRFIRRDILRAVLLSHSRVPEILYSSE